MHLMMDDMEDLCKEFVKDVIGREEFDKLEKHFREFYNDLVEDAGTAWLIWMFRALVFNRSATFVEPRRSGTG